MFRLTAIAAALVTLSVGKRERTPESKNWFAGEAYRVKSAADKLDDLWYMCQLDQDGTWTVPYENLDDMFDQRMGITTCRRSDEMKRSIKKVIHAEGVVGRVSWEALGDHPFTGLFATGSDKGIIRFSESNFAVPEQDGLTPSFAMKFPRDGMESVNMFGAVGFEPQGSWNFFKNTFTNHISVHENELNRETIMLKMAEAGKFIGNTGLGEFSRILEDGTLIDDYVPPFLLSYVPSEDLVAIFEAFGDERPEEGDFRDQLMQIPAGTNLFEVWAKNQPDDHEDHFEKQIANIRLDSDIILSRFGDERLFFQHENMKWDFAYDKSWRRKFEKVILPKQEAADADDDEFDVGARRDLAGMSFPEDREGAMGLVRGSIQTYECPFAWMLKEGIDSIF